MNDRLEETFVSREEIFDGAVLHVVKDRITLPDGRESYREMCLHVGAVAVIPMLDDGRVIMERQYRYAHGRVFLEIPAGKLDSPDEDHLEAVKRELREETGAVAEKYTFLGRLDSTPALIDEKIYMYLAEGITLGERELDEDEFINVELVPLKDLVDKVMSGEICDGKTQIAVLKAARLKGLM